MKIKDFLKLNKQSLKNSDIAFACAYVLNCKRGDLFFNPLVTSLQQRKLKSIFKKLSKGYPLDLILGFSVFYKRKFKVNKKVLKPRQETELVTMEAMKYLSPNTKVLDLCCGSGIIGLTIAAEKKANVTLTDISGKAIKLAKINAKSLGINNVKVVRSNLFNKITGKFDIIISNPPYIATKEIELLDDNVKKFDPVLALDGGVDGLSFYKQIIKQAPLFLEKKGKLVLEIGYNQGKDVLKLMQKKFETVVIKDYNDKDRIIIGELYGKTR